MIIFEKLGAWILDTRAGLIFGIGAILAGSIVLGYVLWSRPTQVTISARDFACAESEPVGIDTRCTAYRRIH